MKPGKLLSFALTLVMILSLGAGIPALAGAADATGNQDGLQAVVSTDKDTYGAGDDVQIGITVTNTSDSTVKDVTLTGVLPSGLKLKSGTLTKGAASLTTGSSLVTTAVAVAQSSGGSTQAKSGLPTAGDLSNMLLPIALIVALAIGLTVTLRFRENAQKIISIFLCVALLAAMTPSRSYAAAAQAPKSFDLAKTIKMGGKDYVIAATIGYTLESGGGTSPTDGSTYTRGQWIQLLTEKMGINLSTNPDDIDYFYGDTIDSPNGIAIEAAQIYGILPIPNSEGYADPEQDIPLFYPDEVATREFVAYTVVKAMGYEGDSTLSCSDANSLLHESEDAIAVQEGYLLLVGNAFLPNDPITGTDKNLIFNRIDAVNASVEVAPGEEKDDITYQPGVVQVSNADYSVTDNGDDTYVVVLPTAAANGIVAGTIFVLPPSDEYISGIALKAINASIQNDGSIRLSCTKPDISDVVNNFDFAGIGIADMAHATLADGVTADYDPNGVITADDNSQLSPYDINISTMSGTKTYNLANFNLGNTGIKVNGKVAISVPKVTLKAKGSVLTGLSLDSLTVSINSQLKATGSLSYSGGISSGAFDTTSGGPKFLPGGEGHAELGRVPIPLGDTGLSLDFVLTAYLSVDGTITIGYTIDNTLGLQYTKGHALRAIKDFSKPSPTLEMNATAKLGLEISARLSLLSICDLAGIEAQAGVEADAKFVAHSDVHPTLYCADGLVFLYASYGLDGDTLLGDILSALHQSIPIKDIFTASNSPLVWKAHLENGVVVAHCTYGSGGVSGVVKTAAADVALSNARVRIFNNAVLIKTLYTDSAGKFSANGLSAGSYTVEISATGYLKYMNSNIGVSKSQITYLEVQLMVDRAHPNGVGTARGSVTNAVTGGTISGASYAVRANWGNTTGNTVTSGTVSGGMYSIDLSPGNYTITFTESGYISSSINVAITANGEVVKNVTLSPSTGVAVGDNLRIVLTWGLVPADLDSHLFGPTVDGNSLFHTCYWNKEYLAGGTAVADLDVDDTTSYGPETTTVNALGSSGTYSFYVHDFTNRSSNDSEQMSMSDAQVRVYSGDSLLATYNVPPNTPGTLWHVFDFDAATKTLIAVNQFSYESDSYFSI